MATNLHRHATENEDFSQSVATDGAHGDRGSTPTLATAERKAGGAERERIKNETFAPAGVVQWESGGDLGAGARAERTTQSNYPTLYSN